MQWVTAILFCSVSTATTASLSIYPPEIKLRAGSPAVVVVSSQQADGVVADVTEECELVIEDPNVAQLSEGQIHPLKTGSTRLTARKGNTRISVPVRVETDGSREAVSFRNDVLPVLTKSGCNAGGCHGAAAGQDGFGLSLFGYDPKKDYLTITRQWVGRRINRGLPEESLLLKKATGAVPHTGGKRMDADSFEYDILQRWIREGVVDDTGSSVPVEDITLYPRELALRTGQSHQLVVIARYADGTKRDVTGLAEFQSTNSGVVQVDHAGVLESTDRGEAFVTVRFDTITIGKSVIVMPAEDDRRWQDRPQHNQIDQLVDAKLRRRGIQASGVCDDETFMRRLSLDLRGHLPTEAERDLFLSDNAGDKRPRLIEAYLASDGFVDVATMRWSDVLKMRSGNRLSRQGVHRYAAWLRERMQNNRPLDQWVHELIVARGETRSNAGGYFFQAEKETAKQAENIAQIFLGMRLQCASCHNHPFDRWTMDDYYSFAAFLAQVGQKKGEDPREIILFNRRSGEIKHPLTGKPLTPKFLGEGEPALGERDRREVMAEWIVSRENPYFARHMANTLWSWLFYRGIVEPVDDVRISNPPVNQPLLDYLAGRLVESGFDARQLLADICASRTYQAEVQADSDATDLFAGQRLRRLPAAVLHDAIVQVTGAQTQFKDTLPGVAAVQVTDGAISNLFLDTFGRSPRETVCTCETRNEPTLSQALHLVNGDTVHDKIKKGALIPSLLAAGRSIDEIVDLLYARCLTRMPTEQERVAIAQAIDPQKSESSLEDLFWAILNSPEFSMNH